MNLCEHFCSRAYVQKSLQETALGKHTVAIMNVRAAHYSRAPPAKWRFFSGRLLRSIASSSKGNVQVHLGELKDEDEAEFMLPQLGGGGRDISRLRLVYAGWKTKTVYLHVRAKQSNSRVVSQSGRSYIWLMLTHTSQTYIYLFLPESVFGKLKWSMCNALH